VSPTLLLTGASSRLRVLWGTSFHSHDLLAELVSYPPEISSGVVDPCCLEFVVCRAFVFLSFCLSSSFSTYLASVLVL
jgi:hypothetical protein